MHRNPAAEPEPVTIAIGESGTLTFTFPKSGTYALAYAESESLPKSEPIYVTFATEPVTASGSDGDLNPADDWIS